MYWLVSLFHALGVYAEANTTTDPSKVLSLSFMSYEQTPPIQMYIQNV